MKDRPDFVIVALAVFAVGLGVGAGVAARAYGAPENMSVLVGNAVFILGCYASTFVFLKIMCDRQIAVAITQQAQKPIDISSLFGGVQPSNLVVAERIWGHPGVVQSVTLKTCPQSIQTVIHRTATTFMNSILLSLVGLAALAIAWVSGSGPLSTGENGALAPSAAWIAVATFAYTLARVYFPVLENAQRNIDLLRQIGN